MKRNHIGGLCSAVILAASLYINPNTAHAQAGDPPPASAEEQQPRPYPFNGTVESVDKEANSITLAGKEKTRTLQLTAATRIESAGKAATLEVARPGDEVAGQVYRADDGREVLVSLRIGPKPGEEDQAGGGQTEPSPSDSDSADTE